MKKIFFKHLLIYLISSFLISFINSLRFNGDFLRLVFVFNDSGSGSSSAASPLASRITNEYFAFQIYFHFLFF